MVRVIEARLRLPIFSIKHPEAFQVRATLPLPQPSTVIGMLAYCLGVIKDVGTTAGEIVRKWVDEGILMAARASLTTSVPPLALSTIVLRRFRVADKAYLYKESETGLKYVEAIKEAIGRRDFRRVKSILETDLTDAFYREYITGYEIKCVWAFSEDVEFQPEWVRLIHRLGDTESLCTVLEVKEVEGEIVEGDVVETIFPTCYMKVRSVEGSYIMVKMCDESFFHQRREGPKMFICPCRTRVERVKGKVIPLIEPSKVKIEYEEPMRIIRTYSGEEITAYTPV